MKYARLSDDPAFWVFSVCSFLMPFVGLVLAARYSGRAGHEGKLGNAMLVSSLLGMPFWLGVIAL